MAQEASSIALHEQIQDPIFRDAVAYLDAGDVVGLNAHLRRHPALVQERVTLDGPAYFRNPTLLEFVAENPIRHGTMPENVVEIARVIVEAGADQQSKNATLALLCSGCIARERGKQLPLINLLCGSGADPNLALPAAAAHGEQEAVKALLAHGARMSAAAAAAMGEVETALALLQASTEEDRRQSLALASQLGHIQILRALLAAGEDPTSFNPAGFHAHSTPLHQAAFAGHRDLVALLLGAGASADVRDLIWHGTPADWAHHGGHTELEAYLRERERPRENG